jgi:hypothetical protein
MATIFMPLLEEGTDVWRPVEVTPLTGAEYRVEGPMPIGEAWQFAPGSLIQLRWKKFDNGERRLVPKGPAPTVRSTFTSYFERNAGILVGVLPLLMIMEWLPRKPDAHLQTAPLLVACALWALLAAIVLIWRNPRKLATKWAAWSALGFGLLFCSAILTGAL